MIRPLILCATLALSLMPLGAAKANWFKSPVEKAVANYIVPKTAEFARVSEGLKNRVEALCAQPKTETLSLARSAFEETLRSFGQVEFIRLGPMQVENRRERLWYWPDRKSLGLRQVQRALAKEDVTVTNQATLYPKSVALQGFGALEFLLFGTDSEDLENGQNPFRCRYAKAVAENINVVAGDIAQAWADSDGFRKVWLNPSPENPRFRTDEEALSALVNVVAEGYAITMEKRLLPLRARNGRRNYKRAMFWRSSMTITFLAQNLSAIDAFSQETDIFKALSAGDVFVATNVAFNNKTAQATLEGLMGEGLPEIMGDETDASKLDFLALLLADNSKIYRSDLTKALNLPSTFSTLDGD